MSDLRPIEVQLAEMTAKVEELAVSLGKEKSEVERLTRREATWQELAATLRQVDNLHTNRVAALERELQVAREHSAVLRERVEEKVAACRAEWSWKAYRWNDDFQCQMPISHDEGCGRCEADRVAIASAAVSAEGER